MAVEVHSFDLQHGARFLAFARFRQHQFATANMFGTLCKFRCRFTFGRVLATALSSGSKIPCRQERSMSTMILCRSGEKKLCQAVRDRTTPWYDSLAVSHQGCGLEATLSPKAYTLRRFQRISEDFRRFQKISEDFRSF